MLRFENVPREDMPEIVKIASELYEQDREKLAQEEARQAEARERQAVVDAVKEVDLPPEYLERAAGELHARRVARVRRRRRMRTGILATAAAALGIGVTTWGVHRLVEKASPPAPAPYHFETTGEQWSLNKNPESVANFTVKDGAATIQVKRLAPPAGSKNFFVNLDSASVPSSLRGYEITMFKVRGAGLPYIRLYLENGPNERWRSPAIQVPKDWQMKAVRLQDFEYQIRGSSAEGWRVVDYRSPDTIHKLSFKVGSYINDKDAQGEVSIKDLEFR